MTETITEGHHATRREVVPGVWEIARPLRDTSWWQRRKREHACRRSVGHCWHPDGFADWWCCMCSAETDGMPEQRCVTCIEVSRQVAGCPDCARDVFHDRHITVAERREQIKALSDALRDLPAARPTDTEETTP